MISDPCSRRPTKSSGTTARPPWSLEEFREKFYLPFPKFYEEHLPEFVLAELDDQYHSSFKVLQNGIALLPHAQDFLDYLRTRGLPTFLLSSIHRDHFEAQGGRLMVKQYFQQAYVQALDKRKTILELLAEHDLNAVGDDLHRRHGARHRDGAACRRDELRGADRLRFAGEAQGARIPTCSSATSARSAPFSTAIAAWKRIRPFPPWAR